MSSPTTHDRLEVLALYYGEEHPLTQAQIDWAETGGDAFPGLERVARALVEARDETAELRAGVELAIKDSLELLDEDHLRWVEAVPSALLKELIFRVGCA